MVKETTTELGSVTVESGRHNVTEGLTVETEVRSKARRKKGVSTTLQEISCIPCSVVKIRVVSLPKDRVSFISDFRDVTGYLGTN